MSSCADFSWLAIHNVTAFAINFMTGEAGNLLVKRKGKTLINKQKRERERERERVN